jgi:hypothetical protein
METKKLEGKLVSCMYDLVDRYTKTLMEVNQLSSSLNFGCIVGRPEYVYLVNTHKIGQKSCDFFQYCLEKVHDNEKSQIVFVDSKLHHKGQLYMFPSLDEIVKMTSPCSHECDNDGYAYNENSKDLRVNEYLQLFAIAQYKETYKHKKQGHSPILWRLPEGIIEILNVDSYFMLEHSKL